MLFADIGIADEVRAACRISMATDKLLCFVDVVQLRNIRFVLQSQKSRNMDALDEDGVWPFLGGC